jgi:hypothetical protein
MSNLEAAIAQKQDQIRQREADLKYPEYPGREWALTEIELLYGEIDKIQTFLKSGGELNLARCCQQPGNLANLLFPPSDDRYLCLIAHNGFNGGCRLEPRRCGFSFKGETCPAGEKTTETTRSDIRSAALSGETPEQGDLLLI